MDEQTLDLITQAIRDYFYKNKRTILSNETLQAIAEDVRWNVYTVSKV